MEIIYPVICYHNCGGMPMPSIICYCKTQADAEEMALSFAESDLYEDYIWELFYRPKVSNILFHRPLAYYKYYVDKPGKIL